MELDNFNILLSSIKRVIDTSRNYVRQSLSHAQLIANFEIGRLIVEQEQQGKEKASYGKQIIKLLSEKLTKEFGSGFDERNLRNFRSFYIVFSNWNSLRSNFKESDFPIRNALRSKSVEMNLQKLNGLESHPLFQVISPKLTWTHYRLLLKVENETARNFYIKESIENNWSTRALGRQINSLYYERILSSKNKTPVMNEMLEKVSKLKPDDILKDPYVLEFLQLKENTSYKETEMEQALIDKLNVFLLELGKGFAFVARQKRVSTETKHFYIDLVFYNYILKCFVLIDLKTGELTHQDIGQMDMYVRLFEDKFKHKDDNPTIGLILCTKKDQTIVKYSVLNENKQLFASKYQMYLPTEKQLIEEIEREKFIIENIKKDDKN
ncbi:MAG: PDDEXK nuclease domain-containing protein [Candidatus Carbobacillus sp.]|nr:PDDEXK nuclease domain-containing protein [Candidatus Carbobacillus sp.]